MAQQLPALNAESETPSGSTRRNNVRLGMWIELATICWMTVEAAVAITEIGPESPRPQSGDEWPAT
jgi:hypothetical protein